MLFDRRILLVAVVMVFTPVMFAGPIADVMCNYEEGLHANTGYTDPSKALSIGGLVSLGTWSDNPANGDGDPVGIILGFSTPVPNVSGNDLNVVGNPFTGWYEPGFVEVARETSGGGATEDGWRDETFYLLKGSNYDGLPNDPRDAAIAMSYFSQADLGYADVAPGGDLMNIDWAIDASGSPVSLVDIAYVRVRTVTDDSAGVFGYYTTEINYVEAIPEPATISLLVLGGVAMFRRGRKECQEK